ncbi:hypothetical protein [Haloferax denitrificans]|uniref:hypothetical protein n=1 Tax=Haloferax denitrificans TaxID=35745 RepID=UPI001268C4F4|nr:hypothetical protein [Haloferax denitrificans]
MGLADSFREHIWKAVATIFAALLTTPLALYIGEYYGLLNVASFNPPISVTDWARIYGAVGSLILSGSLLTVYVLMSQTQGQQVKAMVQQREWMEVQHRPDILITSYEIEDTVTQAREKVRLAVENLGNGVAKDLYLRCDVRVSGNELSSEPVQNAEFEIDGDRFGIKPHFGWLRPLGQANKVPFQPYSKQTSGGYIHAGEESKELEAEVWLYLLEENDDGELQRTKGIGVQDAMLLLHEAGIDRAIVQVSLIYRDMGGNIGGEKVFANGGSLDSLYTLKGIHGASGVAHLNMSDILREVAEENPFSEDSEKWIRTDNR